MGKIAIIVGVAISYVHVAIAWFLLGYVEGGHGVPVPSPVPAPVPSPAPPMPTPAPVRPVVAPPMPPPPKPAHTGTLWVIYLEGTQTTAQAARVRQELAMSPMPKDTHFRAYVEGQSEIASAFWLDEAKGIGFPCVVIIEVPGGLIWKQKAPSSAAEVMAKVDELRGPQ